MKQSKKLLSVLLALVMLLSFGTLAFAEGDEPTYNWTPIPTSPDGLADGEYYLDFTESLTKSMQADETPVTAEKLAAAIAVYHSGTYFVDLANCVMKGSFVVPGAYAESGEDEVQEIPAEGGGAWLPYVLKEVGAEFIPVKKYIPAPDMLKDPKTMAWTCGIEKDDWYVDLSTGDDEIVSFLSRDDLEIYVNPGSTWMEYKFVLGEQVMYLPLNSNIATYVEQYPITQYPYDWTLLPKSTEGLSDGDYYIDVEAYVNNMTDDEGNLLDAAARQQQLQLWSEADYYFDADAVAMYIRLNLPYQNEDGQIEYIEQYVPVDSGYGYIPLLLHVYEATPDTPDQPDQPDEPQTENQSGLQKFVAMIKGFISSILRLFRRLFG